MARATAGSPARPAGSPATGTKKAEGRNLVVWCDGTGNELSGALAEDMGAIR
jgi:hypothetical protein